MLLGEYETGYAMLMPFAIAIKDIKEEAIEVEAVESSRSETSIGIGQHLPAIIILGIATIMFVTRS